LRLSILAVVLAPAGLAPALGACGGGAGAGWHDGGAPEGGAPRPDAATSVDGGDPGDDASRGDGGASCPAPAAGTGPLMTVHGVVSSMIGSPTSVRVSIGGASTTTAADGSFSIDAVRPPYDVLLDDDAVWQAHVAYVGLTRPDPSLVMDTLPAVTFIPSQPVVGTLQVPGAGDAGAPGLLAAVLENGGYTHGEVGSADFNLQGVLVGGAPTESLQVYGIAGTLLPSGGPASIDAVGSAPAFLDGGMQQVLVDVPLDPSQVVASKLTGTIAIPPGATGVVAGLFLGDAEGAEISVDHPGATFSYATFTTALPWTLDVSAQLADGTSCGVLRAGLKGNEDLSLEIASMSAVASAPQNGGHTGCPAFAWSKSSGGPVVHVLDLTSVSSATAPTYRVVTAGDSVHMPFALPAGGYAWSARDVGPVANVDALAASASAMLVLNASGVVADHVYCENAGGSFVVP
jgi:hypothetical protein